MKNLKVNIENLKCCGCANTISKELKKIEGVKNVSVFLNDSSVSIDYESSEDLKSKIIDKLQKIGYPEVGKGKLKDSLRSYVSCAIGRIHS